MHFSVGIAVILIGFLDISQYFQDVGEKSQDWEWEAWVVASASYSVAYISHFISDYLNFFICKNWR